MPLRKRGAADDGKRLEAHFSEQHAMDVVFKTRREIYLLITVGGVRDCAWAGGRRILFSEAIWTLNVEIPR